MDVDGVDLADATVSTYVPPKSMSKRGAGRDYIEPEMFTTVDIVSGTTDVSTDGIGGRVSFKNKSPEDYLVNGKTVAGTVKAGYSSADQAWLSSVTGAVGNDDVKALVAYAHREGNETKPNSKTPAFPSDWTSDAVLTRLLWNLSDQHQLNFTADYYKKKLIPRILLQTYSLILKVMRDNTKILIEHNSVSYIPINQMISSFSIS
ncbi:hypothetical protein PYR74_07535 [Acinetobacter bereziniae]|nr:hypothetical protein PYR74_07535 [Acinetobacter bereziniae]